MRQQDLACTHTNNQQGWRQRQRQRQRQRHECIYFHMVCVCIYDSLDFLRSIFFTPSQQTISRTKCNAVPNKTYST